MEVLQLPEAAGVAVRERFENLSIASIGPEVICIVARGTNGRSPQDDREISMAINDKPLITKAGQAKRIRTPGSRVDCSS